MSGQQSSWLWDTSRRKYYYWSDDEGCYIYEDGTRLRPESQPYVPLLALIALSLLKDLSHSEPNYAVQGYYAQESTGAYIGSGGGYQDLTSQMGSLSFCNFSQFFQVRVAFRLIIPHSIKPTEEHNFSIQSTAIEPKPIKWE
jgi:hypothetical protein